MKANCSLQEEIIKEFSGENAQSQYKRKALEGLWESEKYFIEKYFNNKRAKLLDIGCGTGRTTIPLVQKGFKVSGIDLVPNMIKNARKIAKKEGLKINYMVGDATNLKFSNSTFDYALFSNQGWTQIPGKEKRQKALDETFRVLKKEGLFLLSTHHRVIKGKFIFFWLKQLFRLYILKPLGFNIPELNFGDRFFDRENSDSGKTFSTRQYIHIPSIKEVKSSLGVSGFQILEIRDDLQVSKNKSLRYPPVLYICKKTDRNN